MRKKVSVLLLAACLAGVSLAGCGTKDDVKVISKDNSSKESDSSMNQETKEEKSISNTETNTTTEPDSSGEGQTNTENTEQTSQTNEAGNTAQANLKGYIFQTQGLSETVSMTVDMDAAPVIQSLGEADSYFEAPSCAFQGIDKVYTYSHFEIDTYPDKDTDRISMILFLDDLVSTSEGICIGMTKEDMEQAYGTDYEVSNGFYKYTKDNMRLAFIIKDGEITSIEYDSLVLNEG